MEQKNESMSVHETMIPSNNRQMLIAMVGIGMVCALLITVTYEGTLPRVERLKAEALEQAVFRVVPKTKVTRAFAMNEAGIFELSEGKGRLKNRVYAGYDENGLLTGVAIEASGQGYADVIRILYGYDPNKEVVVGFYVLESKETPGLGDKIEKDARFLANFDQLTVKLDSSSSGLQHSIVPVKQGTKTQSWEVDGITGATISSRAIAQIIGKSAETMIPVIIKEIETFRTLPKSEMP